MPTKVSWATSAEVSGGPTLSAGTSAGINAYALIEENVAAASNGTDGEITIDIQPSDDAADMRCFVLTADRYSEDLTWTVMTAADVSGAANVPLDAPLYLFDGAIGALLQVAPQKVVFTNAGDQPAHVTLLVGRVTS